MNTTKNLQVLTGPLRTQIKIAVERGKTGKEVGIRAIKIANRGGLNFTS